MQTQPSSQVLLPTRHIHVLLPILKPFHSLPYFQACSHRRPPWVYTSLGFRRTTAATHAAGTAIGGDGFDDETRCWCKRARKINESNMEWKTKVRMHEGISRIITTLNPAVYILNGQHTC